MALSPGLPLHVADELPQLGEVEVRYRRIARPGTAPANQVVSASTRLSRRDPAPVLLGPDEDVDGVLPPQVDQGGHASPSQVIQAAPDQRIPITGEVPHLWRDVQPPVEPRLHDVLVRGGHIAKAAGHQRPHVGGYDLLT